MADLQSRQKSENYTALVNEAIIAIVIGTICLTSFELLKRKRRKTNGKQPRSFEGLGSVESWEFGYLYQGRCWAKIPSPPHSEWPLMWIKEAIMFPERELLGLRGLDATLYSRFLRGTAWFALLHTLTTLPILLPIHLVFSPEGISRSSMTRASLSSLVQSPSGKELLYVHLILLTWIASTWIVVLLWILRGALKYRTLILKRAIADKKVEDDPVGPGVEDENRALRYRTVMVSNLPPHLRNEARLQQYFEYYSTRNLLHPPSAITPGFASQFIAFVFNRGLRVAAAKADDAEKAPGTNAPVIVDRVNIVRKMTGIATLVERREEFLRKLEDAHIKLAKKTLSGVKARMLKIQRGHHLSRHNTRGTTIVHDDDGYQGPREEVDAARMEHLVEALSSFVYEFNPPIETVAHTLGAKIKLFFINASRCWKRSNFDEEELIPARPQPVPEQTLSPHSTIWEALHSLPRDYLNSYQPLIRLNALFRGATVPEIDYLNAKLQLLTSLINENRSGTIDSFAPASTAFVTFQTASDARKILKDLPTHPTNPLACVISPAPDYEEIDWARLMKTSFAGEFLKDWVVGLGVWGFTLFWVIPVSVFVGLVNITNISKFVPKLATYLNKHPVQRSLVSGTLPTVLVSLLALLIPLLLLLIAKKAQTFVTLSKLHDVLLTRYYKFLVCNVLIFFCIGTSALESFLSSFRDTVDPLPVVAASFPIAAPFFVGWLIFQTAMQSLLQLALFGLPLLSYPATVLGATTPRKRLAGTRPRTFDYFYWLPNHMTVLIVAFTFAVMNPLVIPFAAFYFSAATIVFKNQFVHVYSKKYEMNGSYLMIRIIRYSLDGLLIAHACVLGLFAVSDKKALIGASAGLMAVILGFKLYLTRLARAKFQALDDAEADALCGDLTDLVGDGRSDTASISAENPGNNINDAVHQAAFQKNLRTNWTWRMPSGAVNFGYSTVQRQYGTQATRRQPIPFEMAEKSPEKPSSRPSSPHPYKSGGQDELSDPTPVSGPLGKHILGTRLPPTSEAELYRSPTIGLVQDHPRRQAWDDRPQIDRPYDNPYYVGAIGNTLWLPRNPCDVIDLDDTVDLYQSITTDSGAGKLGDWNNGDGLILTELVPQLSPEEEGDFIFSQQQDAPPSTTSINLPEDIASRVQTESDVQQAELRPQLFMRRTSALSIATTTRPGLTTRVSDRSLSATVHPRRPSHLSAVSPGGRSVSAAYSQRSRLSSFGALSPGTGRPRANTRSSMGIRDAVVNEVVAEEQMVQEDSYRQETDEEREATPKKGWWNSWLYTQQPETSEPHI